MDKIFTCFNNTQFHEFGISWIASLRTLGDYDGPIYAISFGSLPQFLIDKMKEEKIFILNVNDKLKSKKEFIFDIIQEKIDNDFAYWDINGYFVNSINDLIIKDKILLVKEENGFFAGNKKNFSILCEYYKFCDFCGFKRNFDFHKYFPNSVEFIKKEWNYHQKNFHFENENKFIHFSSEINKVIKDNFSFEKKYPEIYKKWSVKFSISVTKKIFRKKSDD